jgi:hypothetical protein
MQLITRDLEHSSNPFYHLHEDNALAHNGILLSDPLAKIVNCVQSNHHWNQQSPEALSERISYIDEINSVLAILVEGGTFPNVGVQIACANATSRLWGLSRQLILTDGNLSDTVIEAVSGVSGKTFVRIEVIPVDKERQSLTICPSKDMIVGKFVNDCVLENSLNAGKKYALTSDNQSELRRVYELLKREGLQHEQIIIVDS